MIFKKVTQWRRRLNIQVGAVMARTCHRS
ncbi:hypothetical protein V12B01_12810 [Vibrio splendidus 12B01]|nr:hypothetical protein V12B01_12810 [Vibrio splendidus 12B01]